MIRFHLSAKNEDQKQSIKFSRLSLIIPVNLANLPIVWKLSIILELAKWGKNHGYWSSRQTLSMVSNCVTDVQWENGNGRNMPVFCDDSVWYYKVETGWIISTLHGRTAQERFRVKTKIGGFCFKHKNLITKKMIQEF